MVWEEGMITQENSRFKTELSGGFEAYSGGRRKDTLYNWFADCEGCVLKYLSTGYMGPSNVGAPSSPSILTPHKCPPAQPHLPGTVRTSENSSRGHRDRLPGQSRVPGTGRAASGMAEANAT